MPPSDWDPVFTLHGLQMVGGPVQFQEPGRDVVRLGTADVPAMLELAARARPGPFWPRTHELGSYVGFREGGVLLAMAGERLHPPGWSEISAVCMASEARGRGLAALLVRHLAAGIVARGEQPFLHVSAASTSAIELYRRLGFTARRTFRGFRVP